MNSWRISRKRILENSQVKLLKDILEGPRKFLKKILDRIKQKLLEKSRNGFMDELQKSFWIIF